MMDGLISRRSATERLIIAKTLLETVLQDMPDAEKRGKWIEHNPHKWGLGIVYECDQCGEEINCETSNYCPNCGAKMEE